METIGTGILIAIGFYLAPFVIGMVALVAGAILAGIAKILGMDNR